jgi:hypothetical protein
VGDTLTIVFESRGGTKGSRDERNTEYVEGLETLLTRLADARLNIDDILVESRETTALSREKRQLVLSNPYPLSVDDAAALRREISAAQARVGRPKGARGSGNSTRRLRIFLAEASPTSRSQIAALLSGGVATTVPSSGK